MIIRIVKMTFEQDKIDRFLSIFEDTKAQIRQFQGCKHLELWQDKNDPRVFFTYSYWEHEEALEIYRNSALFKSTWKQTKVLFAEKPLAWSVEQISVV